MYIFLNLIFSELSFSFLIPEPMFSFTLFLSFSTVLTVISESLSSYHDLWFKIVKFWNNYHIKFSQISWTLRLHDSDNVFYANVIFFITKESILYVVSCVIYFKIERHTQKIILLSVNISLSYSFKFFLYRITIRNFFIHSYLPVSYQQIRTHSVLVRYRRYKNEQNIVLVLQILKV